MTLMDAEMKKLTELVEVAMENIGDALVPVFLEIDRVLEQKNREYLNIENWHGREDYEALQNLRLILEEMITMKDRIEAGNWT